MKGDRLMAKHQRPADDSDSDFQTGIEEVDLARLLKEDTGKHAAYEDEDKDEE
jgi:hypothetical protein